MYSCILVVGSGMKFQGIGMWLHNRISLQIPFMYRAGTYRVTIIVYENVNNLFYESWNEIF